MKKMGSKIWYVPDCYYSSQSSNGEISHDAICVLNISNKDAKINLTVYFEDEKPIIGFKAICEKNKTNHIRLDKIISENGIKIPMDKPYALKIESNTKIIAQYSRLDTRQSEMALMTTIAY